MIKCKYKESCGPDVFLPYRPPVAQARPFMMYLEPGLSSGGQGC